MRIVAAAAVAVVLVCASVARAGTGGSVGGGSWQRTTPPTYTPSRPSIPSSSPFSAPSTPVYSPPPPLPWHESPTHATTGSGSTGSGSPVSGPPPGWDAPMFSHDRSFFFEHFDWFFGALFLVIVAFAVRVLVFGNHSRPDALDRAVAHADDTDVSVLRVALDGRARKFVQAGLAQIAATSSPATDEGRVKLLRDVSLMLRRLRDAWVYGGAVNDPIRDMEHARAAFVRHVDDARARFVEETIRNDGGKVSQVAPSAYTPRPEEGEGVILVSLVIAARQELFTVKKIGNGDELRRALEAAGTLDVWNLVSVEVVWEPSVDSDRLSSLELEAKYPPPELLRLDGALVGKTFCTYCGGPYPAELISCPHCGAPGKQAA